MDARDFRIGDRVELVSMNDPWRDGDAEVGIKGTVTGVNPPPINTLNVEWDNGFGLNPCLDEDVVRKVGNDEEPEGEEDGDASMQKRMQLAGKKLLEANDMEVIAVDWGCEAGRIDLVALGRDDDGCECIRFVRTVQLEEEDGKGFGEEEERRRAQAEREMLEEVMIEFVFSEWAGKEERQIYFDRMVFKVRGSSAVVKYYRNVLSRG